MYKSMNDVYTKIFCMNDIYTNSMNDGYTWKFFMNDLCTKAMNDISTGIWSINDVCTREFPINDVSTKFSSFFYIYNLRVFLLYVFFDYEIYL